MGEEPGKSTVEPLDLNLNVTQHFKLKEFVSPRVKRDKCAVPWDQVVLNIRGLCQMLLEPWRMVAGPLGVRNGVRDVVWNSANAGDPTSIARAASRAGPHCFGGAADVLILAINKLPEPQRSRAYEEEFAELYRLVYEHGLPVHEAIIEYGKGDLSAAMSDPSKATNTIVAHIHVQYRGDKAPARRFVARKWEVVTDPKTGGMAFGEKYEKWTPGV